jgi:hypothetical protein
MCVAWGADRKDAVLHKYLASINPREIRPELKANLTKLGKDILPQLSLGIPGVELKGHSQP